VQHLARVFPDTDLGEDGFTAVAPVDSFAPNGFGLFNAVGNAWEWCARGNHPGHEGGLYLCHESYCWRYRNSARTGTEPDTSTGHIGFRVVRDTSL
jgi:formylglycine-generating enzyme